MCCVCCWWCAKQKHLGDTVESCKDRRELAGFVGVIVSFFFFPPFFIDGEKGEDLFITASSLGSAISLSIPTRDKVRQRRSSDQS